MNKTVIRSSLDYSFTRFSRSNTTVVEKTQSTRIVIKRYPISWLSRGLYSDANCITDSVSENKELFRIDEVRRQKCYTCIKLLVVVQREACLMIYHSSTLLCMIYANRGPSKA